MKPAPAPDPLLAAIRKNLPELEPKIVFDVGANTGQSVARFSAGFPSARMFAFEPVPATFAALSQAVRDIPNAACFQVALSDQNGSAQMEVRGTSEKNKIILSTPSRGEAVSVRTVRGDAFCAEQNVSEIDFLKIDAEGHDKAVLAGFSEMLGGARIHLVEVEVGISPQNDVHVPFDEVNAFMREKRYQLFHFYGQAMELRFSGLPVMRRINAVYISTAFAEANRVQTKSSKT